MAKFEPAALDVPNVWGAIPTSLVSVIVPFVPTSSGAGHKKALLEKSGVVHAGDSFDRLCECVSRSRMNLLVPMASCRHGIPCRIMDLLPSTQSVRQNSGVFFPPTCRTWERNTMTVAPTVRLSFPAADIALITFDDPSKGANVLSRGVMDEFSSHLDSLAKRTDLIGLIVNSAKPGVFIAGADIREFRGRSGQAEIGNCRDVQSRPRTVPTHWPVTISQRRRNPWSLRGRRRGTCRVVRSPSGHKRSQDTNRISRSETRDLSGVGWNRTRPADDRIGERRRTDHGR